MFACHDGLALCVVSFLIFVRVSIMENECVTKFYDGTEIRTVSFR